MTTGKFPNPADGYDLATHDETVRKLLEKKLDELLKDARVCILRDVSLNGDIIEHWAIKHIAKSLTD
jgi:hypothetical protein